MLDIRAVAYIAPVAEVDFASVELTVRIVNYADEPGLVTGTFRVYNDNTGTLVHTSEIVPFTLAAGGTYDASALTDYDPPAPADDTYFVLFDGNASNALVPDGIGLHLGAFYFDVKPVGMGPAPAAHAGAHEESGADELEISDLATSELDDSLVLKPDGAGGVEWEASPAGVTDHDGLNNLDYASAAHTGFSPNPHDYTNHVGVFWENEHLYPYQTQTGAPWYYIPVNSGTLGSNIAIADHPGIAIVSSSTSANSGAASMLWITSLLIAGTETTDFIIQPQTLAGTTIRLGFIDSYTSTAPTNGVYLEMAQVGGVDGVIVGKTSDNSVRSTTATSYTLVTTTWYRLRVTLNADASLATFTLLSAAGAVLWTDTLATNIPTGATRYTGHGIVATNSGTTAVQLVHIDYQSLAITRTLTR
jgi:hypothetical protein